MKPPSEEIVEAIRTLEIGDGSKELSLPTVSLSADAGYGPVRLALGIDDRLAVLVPTSLGRRLATDLSGEGVLTQVSHYAVGGRTQPFIEVICADPQLRSPFQWLASAILDRLRDGSNPELAVSRTIEDFRSLMRASREFPMERLVGLAGELTILTRLLRVDVRSVTSWTGPLGQRHDFSSVHISAEVKSSLRQTQDLIRVHGFDQLQQPADGRPLVLLHLVFERSGSRGLSVVEMIETARALCASESAVDERLEALGLSHWRLIKSFKEERLNLLRESAYLVDHRFPSLSPQSFKIGHPLNGISDIHYTINLSVAQDCRTDLNEQLTQLTTGNDEARSAE